MRVYILLAEFGQYSDRIVEALGVYKSIEDASAAVLTLSDGDTWEECEILETELGSSDEPRRVKSFRRRDSEGYRYTGPFVEIIEKIKDQPST